MSTLNSFLAKLSEYANNNISAMQGHIQITHNEREDLKLLFCKLSATDKANALKAANDKGIDTASWE